MDKNNLNHKESANRLRAEVLSNAIELEDSLTEALGYLYIPKKEEFYRDKLISDILSDLTFDKKIKLFKSFVQSYPEVFNDYPKIINKLNKIRETRNQMAHRATRWPSPFDYKPIDSNKLDFLKVGKNTFEFSINDLEIYIKECKFLSFYIYECVSRLINHD